MGNRIFSLYVKLDNPTEFKIDDIANSLLKGKVTDQEDNSRSRTEDLINVIYSEYGIEFSNSYLANGVLWFKNKAIIDSFYAYFNRPTTIFIFWNSDFDCSAGFSLIKNGKIVRHRYYFPRDNVNLSEDYGIHGEEEKEFYDWLIKEGGVDGDEYDGEADLMKGKIYPTNQTYYYNYTGNYLVNLVMKKHLGFTMFDYPPNFYKENFTVKLSKTVYELFDVYHDVNTFNL